MDHGTDTLVSRSTRPFGTHHDPASDRTVAIDAQTSEDDTISAESRLSSNGSRTSSHGSTGRPQTHHVIQLSHIEHCMPRAYIRICLAYTVSSQQQLKGALDGLKQYVARVIKAKPYLAGNVTDVRSAESNHEHAEIRFTTENYLNPPSVEVKELKDSNGVLLDYEKLNADGLPPSRLIPKEVSSLLENVKPKDESPVFRVQANIVKGGLIVSIYLHHCVSDGTGFDLITSGRVLDDSFTFSHDGTENDLDQKLKKFAFEKSKTTQQLSTYPESTLNTREIQARSAGVSMPQNKPGRGCVIMLSRQKIKDLAEGFNANSFQNQGGFHSPNTVMMALLWMCMTRARRPSIEHNKIEKSKLLIPVNIRRKVQPALSKDYFGAAVDSGKAVATLDDLTTTQGLHLHQISHLVRQAIDKVDDGYVREMIAFADRAGDDVDVYDIQASNMDRVNGADMYITSWLKQGAYEHELGMGLDGPDWVRKPWSRDPGSCIILPENKKRPERYEVVVQMTEADMDRLLKDKEFMAYVIRVID